MPRTNRYAQDCAACGGQVAKRAGVLERGDGGRWEVRHAACAGVCSTCNGDGKLYGGRLCSACDGTGADMTETREIIAARSGGHPRTGAGAQISVTRFAGGGTSYRNSAGRCEDAPCCGCCD